LIFAFTTMSNKPKEKNTSKSDTMDSIISLCKRRGFIYQGSEIYGGLAGTWDYGPYGIALKNNVKNLWWKRFVSDREDMYGMDAAILMNQKAWVASGHVGGFSDPLVECSNCKRRFRVDQIIDEDDYKEDVKKFRNFVHLYIDSGETKKAANEAIDKNYKISEFLSLSEQKKKDFLNKVNEIIPIANIAAIEGILGQIEKLESYSGKFARFYLNQKVTCPSCGVKDKWSEPRQFNMMFRTTVGAVESEDAVSYLRPETAQGMFVNFENIMDSFHPKMPFGIAQIGKAFRNEIAPRDFLFRVREFEQMEVEYFIDPKNWEKYFDMWEKIRMDWCLEIGLPKEKIHIREHAAEELSHYSKRTTDIEFDYPFGQKELYGLAYRTDFDLNAHSKNSGVDLSYFDEETKKRFIPHVIEPSVGVDRAVLAILTSAYVEDEMNGEKRTYLKLAPSVAPIKIAVFPLLKNKPELVKKAEEIYVILKKQFGAVEFDDNGNIGKRYRRQDEIGTPFCVTIDFDTIEKNAGVTVRDRDSGKQERVSEKDLIKYFSEKFQ